MDLNTTISLDFSISFPRREPERQSLNVLRPSPHESQQDLSWGCGYQSPDITWDWTEHLSTSPAFQGPYKQLQAHDGRWVTDTQDRKLVHKRGVSHPRQLQQHLHRLSSEEKCWCCAHVYINILETQTAMRLHLQEDPEMDATELFPFPLRSKRML